MNKTVYFLGAGFSKDAGGPIQNGIIETIFKPQFKNAYSDKKEIMNALKAFSKFLRETLLIKESSFAKIPLEDVFTPIDRCIADGKSFGEYTVEDLVVLSDFVLPMKCNKAYHTFQPFHYTYQMVYCLLSLVHCTN